MANPTTDQLIARIQADPEDWDRFSGVQIEIEALGEAIAWTWTRLRDAGAVNRGGSRQECATIADGALSEDETRRLWRELRQLGSRRKALRLELRGVGMAS